MTAARTVSIDVPGLGSFRSRVIATAFRSPHVLDGQEMRYRLTAEATGDGIAEKPFVWDVGEYRVGLQLGERGVITHVWADMPITDYAALLPEIRPSSSGPHAIMIPKVPGDDRLTETLQFIESLGSFWFGIERLNWADAKLEWIPESPDEQTKLSLCSYAPTFEYPSEAVALRPEILTKLLERRDSLEYLTIPMSFYREGRNDHREHKYVSAFYNFYFFLEGVYGAGKTKNRAVLHAFKSSHQLKTAFKEAYDQLNDPAFSVQRIELAWIMTRIGYRFALDHLIAFTVTIRGELHHYSQKSSRPKGHPLNQREFRPVAYLGFLVCTHLVRRLANGESVDAA